MARAVVAHNQAMWDLGLPRTLDGADTKERALFSMALMYGWPWLEV